MQAACGCLSCKIDSASGQFMQETMSACTYMNAADTHVTATAISPGGPHVAAGASDSNVEPSTKKKRRVK